MRLAATLASGALALAACGGAAPAAEGPSRLVLVSAPVSSAPWIGSAVERGARLAAQQLGDVRVEVRDNRGSPQQVVAHAREAVDLGAAAMVTDGVGAVAVAEVSDPAALPVFVVFEGGASLVDPAERPTVFRLAPSNTAMSRRLAAYLSEQAGTVSVLGDDSSYGREGTAATLSELERNGVETVAPATLPTGARDVSAQVLAARRAGAEALVVWTGAAGVAAVVEAARSSGWDVPVYTGPTGEDPLVRQQLADHPEWVEGLTFVSFRITSEVGPEPFAQYRAAYEAAYGPDRVGVGDLVQPPDWSTYSYDAVKLVHASLAVARGRTGQPLVDALQTTVITGANGDERGYGPTDLEGVSPDDMYFGRFGPDLRFAPVTDDILSTNLPAVAQ